MPVLTATLLGGALLGGVVAAAIAAAPIAGADRGDTPGPSPKDTPSEMERPGHKFTPAQRGVQRDIPQGWKNEALWARPGAPGNAPFRTGPRPPVIGLD